MNAMVIRLRVRSWSEHPRSTAGPTHHSQLSMNGAFSGLVLLTLLLLLRPGRAGWLLLLLLGERRAPALGIDLRV